jgi:putative ABC transport system substrate-binding protein
VITGSFRTAPSYRRRAKTLGHVRFRAWAGVGLLALLGLGGCGAGDNKEDTAAAPVAPGQPAVIAGTIDLDQSLQAGAPKAPLLMILVSKSADPNRPAIIVSRVPGATFPYRYRLTAEDITLVGSTLDGKVYVTARIDSAGMVGATKQGTLTGTYPHNPATVGSTNVDITMTRSQVAAARPELPGAKVPRIGLLWSGSTPFDPWSIPEALRHGFRELGYVEGKDVAFEPRYAEARYDRLPGLAAELVRLKVDVILAAGDSAAVQATARSSKTIPIVMMAFADAVQLGLVGSLAQPGGNLTGLSFPFAELVGKQLELLKASMPGVSRVAVLWNPANPGHKPALADIAAAVRPLDIRLQFLEVRDPDDFESAFSAMSKGRASAFVVLWDPMLHAHSGRLTRHALSSRLPAVSAFREFVEAGGLMSYGPNLPDVYRGAASYVDKILKGANPANLPVEQPTKFTLVINLTTAKALGLSIPQAVLLRADEVIR